MMLPQNQPMHNKKNDPRILIITPEITYIPTGMGHNANYFSAKAGGLADVSAALVSTLYDQGADVHIAIPDYRTLFVKLGFSPLRRGFNMIRHKMSDSRIHLAQDRAFFYLNRVYSDYGLDNIKIALIFQRELLNNIIPRVQPDLIHCNDWMTALIPAMAREMDIPCLFTIHNIYSVRLTLEQIENQGIDAAYFWNHLFYDNVPSNYENTREWNQVDFLTSGIFASHFVNTVSPTFLQEIVHDKHHFIDPVVRRELKYKWQAGCATGILNAPDTSFHPNTDTALVQQYSANDHGVGKKTNKIALQKLLGLIPNQDAPLLFWPSRLDPTQKGCDLLLAIIYDVVSKYWAQQLEIVFIASGEYQQYVTSIIKYHNFSQRVAITDFDEKLSRLAFAASDFILMPSLFEPCGLPQMIGTIYGSLPVAHNTGGLHDTITHLNIDEDTGNGFVFETFDTGGLFWAIDQAMQFYFLPEPVKATQIHRIMQHGADSFNHDVSARQYIQLYEKMLQRPLITPY